MNMLFHWFNDLQSDFNLKQVYPQNTPVLYATTESFDLIF